MKPRNTFAVGDEVIVKANAEPRKAARVARVLARFVELDDGTKWAPDGSDTYPRPGSHWGHAYVSIVPGTPELRTRLALLVKLRRAGERVEEWRRALAQRDADKIPDSALDALLAASPKARVSA